jgi:hypothetical protein
MSPDDPFLSLVTGSFEAVKNTEPYERWGILGLAGIAFRVATVFCANTPPEVRRGPLPH